MVGASYLTKFQSAEVIPSCTGLLVWTLRETVKPYRCWLVAPSWNNQGVDDPRTLASGERRESLAIGLAV